VILRPAPENYIEYINGATAGVIIGDRALQQRTNFEYIYDLADAWKDYTGLSFVFAAWVANKDLPEDFLAAFNKANAEGLNHLPEVVAENPYPYYDLMTYYTENIKYELTAERKKGLEQFLSLIS
jgi:chorismate dehydratase